MVDQEAALRLLLGRHPDVTSVEPVPGLATLIRRDQLLVTEHDSPVVVERARRWCEPLSAAAGDLDDSGVVRIRLRARSQVDVCELAAGLREGTGRRALSVSPNHIVRGQPLWWSGPAGPPSPGSELAAPAPRPGDRPVTVAVLDTGLSPHRWYEHEEWYTRQRHQVTEVLDADLDHRLDAQAGHGTFIAGVILRRAPSARVLATRVIGGDGVGDELAIIRALSRLTRSGPVDLVNLSLGCHTYDDRPTPLMARAVGALCAGQGGRAGPGPVVVACAGNSGHERPFWPAALKQVIAVGALDGDDRATFSNHGWWVDACAQGVKVKSCFPRFDGPGKAAPGTTDPDLFTGFATWSGTSFATPAVAGAIAAVTATDGLSPAVAASRILDPRATPPRPDLGVEVR